MRKLTYAIALSTLLLAGCSQDEGIMESKGELVTLNYKVSLGKDVQSRNTTGEGTSSEGTSSEGTSSEGTTTEGTTPTFVVNKLLCVVYEDGKTEPVLSQIVDVDATTRKAKFSPQLFTTINYRIVFWAYYDSAEDGADFYNLDDLSNITVKDDYYTTEMANVYKDAFTATIPVNLSQNTGTTSPTLTRPFAQVTLLTSVEDYNETTKSNDDHLLTPSTCTLTISSCNSVYNAKGGFWEEGEEGNGISVTSKVSTDVTKTIGEVNYYYLANEYIFAGGENANCGIVVKGIDKDNKEQAIYSKVGENKIQNVPLTGNQSTNMYNKNLLVGTVDYEISISLDAFVDENESI